MACEGGPRCFSAFLPSPGAVTCPSYLANWWCDFGYGEHLAASTGSSFSSYVCFGEEACSWYDTSSPFVYLEGSGSYLEVRDSSALSPPRGGECLSGGHLLKVPCLDCWDMGRFDYSTRGSAGLEWASCSCVDGYDVHDGLAVSDMADDYSCSDGPSSLEPGTGFQMVWHGEGPSTSARSNFSVDTTPLSIPTAPYVDRDISLPCIFPESAPLTVPSPSAVVLAPGVPLGGRQTPFCPGLELDGRRVTRKARPRRRSLRRRLAECTLPLTRLRALV